MKKNFIFLSLIAVLAISCMQENNFPETPAIKFNQIINKTDSIQLWIDFTDGDGDFGLEQGDTTGSFDDCLRQYNLYLTYQEKQNGVWIDNGAAEPGILDPCVNEDAVPFYYRVPWARPTGQDQTQEGTIKLRMQTYYLPSEYDTCRFRIQIVDRSLKESNVVFSSEFRKP